MPIYLLTLISEQFKVSSYAVCSPYGTHHGHLAARFHIIPMLCRTMVAQILVARKSHNVLGRSKVAQIFELVSKFAQFFLRHTMVAQLFGLLYGLIRGPWVAR